MNAVVPLAGPAGIVSRASAVPRICDAELTYQVQCKGNEMKPIQTAALSLIAATTVGCAALSAAPPMPMKPGVVQFDLNQVDAQGTRPKAGFQPLTYEMCVPNDPGATGGIESIDRTARCHPGVPGRAGCRPDQALCVGNTGQPNWFSVLSALSNEPFVRRIVDSGLPTPPSN